MRFDPRAIVGLLSAGLLCLQLNSFAQEAPPTSNEVDLSSTQQSVAATTLPTFSSVSINVGDVARTVTPTDYLTPAETIAVMQVLAQGQQSILLGASGNAVGGTFHITSSITQNLHSLVIPQGVTAISDFANISALSMTGNFVNSGTFYAVSSNSAITQAAINSANISNLAGATITSVLPTSGLAGCSNLVSSLSLVLNATNNIYNAGTIASSADLTMTAGGAITNTSTASMTAVMQAVNNVNLMSSLIENSGVIAAQMGNINIASATAQNLVINNIAGRLEAALGSINIRDANFTSKNHMLLWGGDVVSEVLNIYSGTGVARVNVNDLVGLTNIYAGEAHVQAATSSLNLGTIELSGDPTFYNTLGDVTINGPLEFAGAPLAVVAKGDILTASGVGNIKTSSTTGHAGAITLIAGADVHLVSGGPNDVLPTNPQNPGDTTTQLEIRGASSTGGSITLTNVTALEAEGSTTSGTGDGGAITLIAFADPDDGSKGVISVPTGLTIKSGGRHANGNVTIIAGATSGTSITTGAINVNSVGSSTNVNGTSQDTITAYAATPTLTAGTYVYIQNGAMTGSFTPGTLQSATVNLGTLTAKAANIDINAGGNVTISSIADSSTAGTGSYDGGSVVIHSGADVSLGAVTASGVGTGKGGNVDISGDGVVSATSVTASASTSGAGGTIAMYGGTSLTPGTVTAARVGSFAGGKVTLSGTDVILKTVTTTGGPLAVVASGNITTASLPTVIDTSSTTGSGGALTLIAGAAFTNTSTSQLSVTGASTTGGIIKLITPNAITGLTSQGSTTSGTGAGGNITLIAYGKPSDGSLGTIQLPSTVQVRASGGVSGGTNGTVTIIAGAGSGTAIDMGSLASNIGTLGTGAITVGTTAASITGGSVSISAGAITSGSFGLGTQTSAGVNIGNYTSAANIYIKSASVTDISSINTSANGGRIDIISDSSLTVTASSGTGLIMRASGSGANTILLSASSGAITLADDRTFDAGTGGSVSFVADSAGGAINISSGNTVTIQNSTATFRAPNINLLGANSKITSTKTTGTGIIIDNGTVSETLTIKGPDSATGGTISTSGSSVTVTANNNQDVAFTKVAGTNTSTINFNAPTTVTATNSTTSIASSVTVATNNAFTFNANNGTFTNNGTISSTDTTLRVQSTGTLLLNGTPAAATSITGTNAQMIVSAASNLTVASDYAFSLSSTGTASISSTSGSVELQSGAEVTVSGGSSLSSTTPLLAVSTSNLKLNDGSGFIINKTSNMGAQFTSPTSTLTVTLANDSDAHVQTTGASLSFAATGTSAAVNFTKSAGADASSLAVTGGTVTVTSADSISIGAAVTVSTNNTTSLTSNSLRQNGALTASQGNVDITTNTVTANGSISATQSGATITVHNQSSPTTAMQLSGDLAFAGGAVTITSNGTALTIASGSDISADNDITINNTGANVTVAGSISAPSKTVAVNISGSGNVLGGGGTIAADSVEFSLANGDIGTSSQPISTDTGDISISSCDDVYISNVSQLNFTNFGGGNIGLFTGDDLYIDQTINIAGNIQLVTAGTLHLDNTHSLTSTSGQITLGADLLEINGSITAGQITLYSAGTREIAVGSTTNVSGKVDLNTSVLSLLSTSQLTIGKSDSSANISLAGTVTLSSMSAVPVTNLTFATAGNFSSSTYAIQAGSNTVNFVAAGTVTVGSLTGTAPVLTMTGGNVTLTASVTDLHLGSSSVNTMNLTVAGNIVIDQNVSSTGSASLITTGNTSLSVASGKTLSSTNGPMTISARSLSLSGNVTVSSGSLTIYPNDSQAVKVGASGTTSGVFNLTTGVLSHVSATSLVIGKSTMSGNITIGGNIDLSTIAASSLPSMTFLTAGTFNSNNNSFTLGSGQLVVTSGGDLSINGITGTNPTVTLTGMGVWLLSPISTSAGTISVTANSWLAISGDITMSSGGTLTVAQVTSNGPFNINANIGGSSTTVNLSSACWQGLSQLSGVVIANSLTLTVTGGNIGTSSNRFDTQASAITVNASNRNAYLANSGTLTLNSSTAGYLDLSNDNNMTVSGALSTSSMQLATSANNGSITISNNISSPSYLVLSAHGSGNISQTTGSISTSALCLISTSGNIGSSTAKINTNAFYLQVATTGNGYIQSTGSVYVVQPTSGNTLSIQSGGQLEVGSTINATTLTLASAGTIIITGNITATTATLNGSGNGNILRNGGVITATTLALSTGSGTIGTSSNKISTTATSISVSNTGGLHLNSTNTGTVTLTSIASGYADVSVAGAMDATGDVNGTFGVELNSSGAMTVNDVAATNGSVSLTADGGTLTIAAGAVVRADEGNLNIRQNDTTNGYILIDAGANIGAFTVGTPNASKGNVTITIGAPPSTPTAGSTPSNVTEYIVAGGQIFYGANGIDAQPSTNTLNAIGGTMIFDTGSRSSSAITLGGGVTITADPPLLPDDSLVPGGPDAGINLGFSDIVIESHHLDGNYINPFLQPIAYTPSIAPDEEILEPIKGMARTEFGTSTIRHSQFSKFNLEEGYVSHSSGDILVETKSDAVRIVAGKHSVQIAPNTVVLISKEAQLIKVRPLYETSSNAVRVSTGNMSTRVFAGQELILAEDEDSLKQTLGNDSIGRRKTHMDPIPNNGIIHRCEVSPISLIENNYILTKLIQSTHERDKQVTKKLVKMAACMMSVTNSHGPYSSKP
ncbi:MAG: hypothetical protein K2Y22_11000 [Candidatus Obscuribacterales bacterium]|nr:hypothetical protein [Candidatus Obscuribacterales bacterium]